MIFKGFRFGLMLQLAVGPIGLFIFQTSVREGFLSGMIGVVGVTVTDGLFIVAAIMGVGAVINHTKAKNGLKFFGGAVLIVFGISTILGVFEISLIPIFTLSKQGGNNIFLQTVFLTASNPLTILFWAGVFSAKLSEASMGKDEMLWFGFGAAISTFLFQTTISTVGGFIGVSISGGLMNILNIIVGVFLIAFGFKTFYSIINSQ